MSELMYWKPLSIFCKKRTHQKENTHTAHSHTFSYMWVADSRLQQPRNSQFAFAQPTPADTSEKTEVLNRIKLY